MCPGQNTDLCQDSTQMYMSGQCRYLCEDCDLCQNRSYVRTEYRSLSGQYTDLCQDSAEISVRTVHRSMSERQLCQDRIQIFVRTIHSSMSERQFCQDGRPSSSVGSIVLCDTSLNSSLLHSGSPRLSLTHRLRQIQNQKPSCYATGDLHNVKVLDSQQFGFFCCCCCFLRG